MEKPYLLEFFLSAA